MPNLLDTGAAWLDRQFKAYASTPVVYRRGESEVTVAATIGRTEHAVDPGDGGPVVKMESRDYLVHVADLVIAGTPVQPRAGDRVRETNLDGSVSIYEVAQIPGSPVWRYSDQFRRRYRLHTKFVAVEPI